MSNSDTIFGYFKSNIKRSVIEECLASGEPDIFFQALRTIIEEMDEEIENNAGEFPWDWEDTE